MRSVQLTADEIATLAHALDEAVHHNRKIGIRDSDERTTKLYKLQARLRREYAAAMQDGD